MKKLLIANRGEIACRIIRAARQVGIKTVAVYSEADIATKHVADADEIAPIGPATARDSYLNAANIIAAARATGADAVHPGYGFLSENADFAQSVISTGLVWVGPQPETIRSMGDKAQSREIARSAGVPVLPGSRRFGSDVDDLESIAKAVGFPLLVKASGGGGGIGVRVVDRPDDLETAVATTQRLALRSFGNGDVFLERYVPKARHVEVQIFGAGDGRALHVFERECSIQRRFQKVIEESPSPALDEESRSHMAQAAVRLASRLSYASAGTVEFIVDDDTGEFFFLEMNTRIQVEHPVTEMLTGVDLVQWQLRMAAGEQFTVGQDQIVRSGHVIECRIYAENPDRNFLPSAGALQEFQLPSPGPDLRIDTGLRKGDAVTPHYDPMIAKLICRGEDRAAAICRAIDALRSVRIEGIKTNVGFLIKTLEHPDFRAGDLSTSFIERHKSDLLGEVAIGSR
ncbi:MAG TPA: biotin carboxylase N-terminal domain-containing protein [Rhodoblastus sp.]|nr:biotin carboxylase N-terminal domain-containing protein [Rhodoblastus sp.]